MSDPIATVVKIAATPVQAKLFVAMLQAEGIPAHVDGDSLADELALSRRLMNLQGVRVLVPTASLERAKTILEGADVSVDDLEEQAVAAASNEREPAPRTDAPRSSIDWRLLGVGAVAVTFGGLWVRATWPLPRDPLFDWVVEADGLRCVQRADGKTVSFSHDADFDRVFERVDFFNRKGVRVSTSFDEDENGFAEKCEVYAADGSVETWTDADGDGRFESGVVQDAQKNVVQRLTRRNGELFVIDPR
ncbi:MAG: hypothetical protein JNK78_13440 [Planctomycetes bacterium]|nr:hypothetical protein [Planctomycetota bacterium]